MAADLLHLHRKSTGLSAAHVALIKLLAARAVEDFLRESEAASECTDEAAQQHEGITR